MLEQWRFGGSGVCVRHLESSSVRSKRSWQRQWRTRGALPVSAQSCGGSQVPPGKGVSHKGRGGAAGRGLPGEGGEQGTERDTG